MLGRLTCSAAPGPVSVGLPARSACRLPGAQPKWGSPVVSVIVLPFGACPCGL